MKKLDIQIKFVFLASISLIMLGTTFQSQISAEENVIPDWIRGVANFWAEGKISDQEFLNAIEFLIKHRMIKVSTPLSPSVEDTQLQETNSIIDIQEKTKLLAKQWSDKKLTDKEYVKKLQDMIDSKQIEPFNVIQNDNTPSYAQDVNHIPTKYEIKNPFNGTKTIKIKKGDTVEWINADIVSHTVTSGIKEYGYDGNFFDRSLSPNSHTSHTFLSAGTFNFYCKFGNQYLDDMLYTHEEKMMIEVIDTSPDVGIPVWIIDNARFWSNDQIPFDNYLKSIEWLVKNNYLNNSPDIISNPSLEPKTLEQLVRENALQWANNEISDQLYLDNVAKFISNHTIGPPTYGSHEEIYDKTIPLWIKDNAMQYGLGKSNIEEYKTALNYLWRIGLLKVSY